MLGYDFLADRKHTCSERSQRLPAQSEQWIMNDRRKCWICSKLTVKTLGQSQLRALQYFLVLIRLRSSHRSSGKWGICRTFIRSQAKPKTHFRNTLFNKKRWLKKVPPEQLSYFFTMLSVLNISLAVKSSALLHDLKPNLKNPSL